MVYILEHVVSGVWCAVIAKNRGTANKRDQVKYVHRSERRSSEECMLSPSGTPRRCQPPPLKILNNIKYIENI